MLKWLVGVFQLYLGQHEASILSFEHIDFPGKISCRYNVSGFDND